jgi:hypothetical protein
MIAVHIFMVPAITMAGDLITGANGEVTIMTETILPRLMEGQLKLKGMRVLKRTWKEVELLYYYFLLHPGFCPFRIYA